MKKFFTLFLGLIMTTSLFAAEVHGWPENYSGVMLQGFYWDSYDATKWTNLESQANELGQYFSLVWLPQSGNCGGQSMGYDDQYWFPVGSGYTSSFGNETELRSLIGAFKANGIGTIADVVINHRKSNNGWFGFPSETYKGVTYTMSSTDVCSNDDNGKAQTEANRLGVQLGNADTGEGWDGMRDLDHKSTNVQTTVKAYLKMLLNDLGYIGFRYDMVKGYSGSFTGMYNTDAGVEYSVGECWDGTATIRNWIDATKVNGWPTSAAFDFQFKYVVKNAANNKTWYNLHRQNEGNWPLVSDEYDSGNYRRWAITFIENHDTEVRPNGESNGPLTKDTLAANAYMLAMPGTPCVFLKHWIDCKDDIKAMINVRKAAGIHSQCKYSIVAENQTYFAVKVGPSTSDYRLLAVVGTLANTYNPDDANFVKVLSGYHYAYYLNKSVGTAWIDLASGEYDSEQKATLTAVSTNSNAKLVYTTDGSTPTASSTQVASGSQITIPVGTTTLKVGLLINGAVSGIITRTYKVNAFEPYDIDIYVNTANVNWSTVNYWTWGGDGSHSPTNTNWPGDKVTATKTISGKTWYYKTFHINSSSDFVNFVFSTGSGSPQTVNVENIKQTSYFEISTSQSDGKYLVNDVTSTYSGITNVLIDDNQSSQKDNAVYDLMGRKVADNYQLSIINCQLPKGIYIHNGKKIAVK